MAEPDNLVLALLREMRNDMNQQFRQMGKEVAEARSDIKDMSKRIDHIRQAVTGESVLGRYAAAEVEGRLEELEARLSAVEKRRTPPRGGKPK